MAFAKPSNKKTKSNLPDNQLVIKVPTSKGFVTLGKIGLYNESNLHTKVTALDETKLKALLAKAEISIVAYSANIDDDIELDI